jgi:hypothetical protein
VAGGVEAAGVVGLAKAVEVVDVVGVIGASGVVGAFARAGVGPPNGGRTSPVSAGGSCLGAGNCFGEAATVMRAIVGVAAASEAVGGGSTAPSSWSAANWSDLIWSDLLQVA